MKTTILTSLLFLITLGLTAQISINEDGSQPDESAMLDVKSNDKGFLPPRMTTAQRDAIANPGEGLMIWCSDCSAYGVMQVYNGTNWASTTGWKCGDDIVDQRDGTTYSTVQIGLQCWMAENLNYDQNAFGNDWCYDDNAANCNTYGRLYDWAAVMQGASSSSGNPSGVHGICPDGWNIPSDAEWTTLTSFLGGLDVAGDKMKEAGTAHWSSGNNGTNSSGFTALGGGGHYPTSGYSSLTFSGAWWTSTESSSNSDKGWFRSMNNTYDGVFRLDHANKLNGFSVRCLKE